MNYCLVLMVLMDILPACRTCGTPISHLLPEFIDLCNSIHARTGGIPFSTNILTASMTEETDEQLNDFLNANIPNANGKACECCKLMFLTYMRPDIPYGEMTIDGILDVNMDIAMDIVSELD